MRDYAEAARRYAKAQHLGIEASNYATEIKLRAEREIGKMLAQTISHQGGRPRGENGAPTGTVSSPSPRLTDVGLNKKKSAKAQVIASVPDADFERHLAETQQAGEELTTASVYRLAKHKEAKEKQEHLLQAPVISPRVAVLVRVGL
jgi:hypothetical protein